VNGSLSERSARWAISHRRIVVAFWLLLTGLGVAATAGTGDRLSYVLDLPGQPAYETNTEIVERFGNGGRFAPLVVVVTLPEGTTVDSPGVGEELAGVFGRASAALPGARTASWTETGDRAFVSADGRTTFALVYPRGDFAARSAYAEPVAALGKAMAGQRVAGAPVHLTGATILAEGGESQGNSVLVETLIAAAAALVVLAVVFGSLLALLPLLIAAVAIPVAFIGIYGFTHVTSMSFQVQNIVALVGLGVAIDYALLVVTRWREERANGLGNREAVIRSAGTAGSAVVLSGVTVTVSLAALALTTVPFLRSIGLGAMLVPLVSILVTVTLLPVILDAAGNRLEWPRRRSPGTVSRLWTAIARVVVRHRIVATAGSLAVLGLLIAPVAGLNLGQPQATATAATAPADARAGLEGLTSSGIGAGVLRPTEILTDGTEPAPEDVPDGLTMVAPENWGAGGSRVVDVWSAADPSSDAGRAAVDGARELAATVPGARVGGGPAEDAGFIDTLYGRNLLIIVAAIVLVTTVLLCRALRSIWLPVKALLLNLVSLAAAFGVLTWIWQEGHGTQTLFGSPATGAVTLWVPLAVFALLFGLSMDYEVFILSRINEEYEAGHDVDEAVVRGIGHTGRLVSCGALILFLTFVALGGVPQTDVKILSTGLAAGIIIDATIIRGVLAPALVALLGRANWWLPAPVARLLRVEPIRRGSPAAPRDEAVHQVEATGAGAGAGAGGGHLV
jgi:RND superfamily putative drug exporter